MPGKIVTWNFFQALGVEPIAGRGLVAGWVYEIQPFDPLTAGGAALLFLLTSAAAALLPARKAARTDPMAILRSE